MKASSLLFGDLADIFQDSHIEDAQLAAESAQSSALYVGRQVAVLRRRLRELERDNALVAVVLLHALRRLESGGQMTRAEFTASLRDELGKLREQKCDDFLNVFREELGLPRQPRTDVASHKPLPPQSPNPKHAASEPAKSPKRKQR